MGLAGPVFGRLVLVGGFTTYLDRTWDVTLRDSMLLRGTMQPYSDELTSDGGVADLRLAAALRVRAPFALGGALHLPSGSTRGTTPRTFHPPTDPSIRTRDPGRHDGRGAPGGRPPGPLPRLA